ncbi:hypothetical protein JHK84_032718 [Glycine max]|nr:hypothetical protein JHK84_032718 [Glycine max]
MLPSCSKYSPRQALQQTLAVVDSLFYHEADTNSDHNESSQEVKQRWTQRGSTRAASEDAESRNGVFEPDEVTMGIAVLLYKRPASFEKLFLEFFRRWIRGAPFRLGVDDKVVSDTNFCLSSHTYATLIDTYGRGGQFRAACETFARMIKQGRALNTVALNT